MITFSGKSRSGNVCVITSPCIDVKDKGCVAACPVDCIKEFPGESMLYIDPEECIGCDLCIPACPVEAIFRKDQVPANEQQYIQINADKCRTLGSTNPTFGRKLDLTA